MAHDDMLLWIATALPVGILIGLAAMQGLNVIVKRRRQRRQTPPLRRRATRAPTDR